MSKCVFPFSIEKNILILLGSHLKRYISFEEMKFKTLDYILSMLSFMGVKREEILITSGPEEEIFDISHRFPQYNVKPLFQMALNLVKRFYNDKIHLIEKADQLRLVTKLLMLEGVVLDEIDPHIIFRNIRDREAMGIKPRELEGMAKKPLDRLVAKIYSRYLEELEHVNLIDKRLALLKGSELLRAPNVFSSFDRFKVIVVISGQILFHTERAILSKFISEGVKIIALANDNLDIFGWQDIRFNDLMKLEELLGAHLLIRTTDFLVIPDNSEVRFFYFEDEKKEAEYLCNVIDNDMSRNKRYVIMCNDLKRREYLVKELSAHELVDRINISNEVNLKDKSLPIVLLKDMEECKQFTYPEGKEIYQSLWSTSFGKSNLKDGRG